MDTKINKFSRERGNHGVLKYTLIVSFRKYQPLTWDIWFSLLSSQRMENRLIHIHSPSFQLLGDERNPPTGIHNSNEKTVVPMKGSNQEVNSLATKHKVQDQVSFKARLNGFECFFFSTLPYCALTPEFLRSFPVLVTYTQLMIAPAFIFSRDTTAAATLMSSSSRTVFTASQISRMS
jgi:hypothetical protein